ncbi:MAG TPA: oxygen-independent coproporphyrinogen III oxidase [Chitinophagaceae bacterium]|nr:oxygen-independent coproporphyrinogen III oxidase [Chitinophagaceae bacterium]
MNIDPTLLSKYNIPVPRYTSYPTVPFWNERIDTERWKQVFTEEFSRINLEYGTSLYIHLPFCESLCTYCGCNKKITTNHSVEEDYIETITKEWKLYRQLMGGPPIIREIHLGGGTPTFFSPANLELLINSIVNRAVVHPHREFSIEGHPNNTTKEHLKSLYGLGFRRISYGVQDHDPIVQRVINRIQPLENVRKATDEARDVGFKSVNFDLIYGLPKQTLPGIEKTIRQTIELKPDRIAFYSYAHVPWTSRGQRLFDENDLPSAREKLQLYLKGKELLTAAGYIDIGMDHFALPGDDLYNAWMDGTLHRSFMGYTTHRTSFLLGLGVSSISDIGVAFAQSVKTLHDYYEAINKNELAIVKGYFLNEEDISFRRYILNIICRGFTTINPTDLPVINELCFPELQKLEADGLIKWNEKELIVTSRGRHFIRNISSAFDLHLQRNRSEIKPLFSKAI